MKYITIVPCLVAVFASVVSCDRKPAFGDGPVALDVASTINSSPVNEADINSFFDVVGWTAIHTDDSTLMAGPQVFGYDSGTIYIWDTETVWGIRESDGAAVFRFNKKGNGHGEYSSLSDVVFDGKNKRIYATDGMKNKVLAYTVEGKYLPEYSRDSLAGMSILPDGNLVGINPQGSGGLYHDVYDSDWMKLRDGTVRYFDKESFFYMMYLPIEATGGECYFKPFRSDTLYRVTSESDIPAVVFDYGKYAIQDDFFTNPANMSKVFSAIFMYGNPCLAGDIVFYSFEYEGMHYSQVWDLRTASLLYGGKDKDHVKSQPVFQVSGQSVSAWPFCISGRDVLCVLTYQEAVKLVPDLKEDDNPVLLHLRYTGPGVM